MAASELNAEDRFSWAMAPAKSGPLRGPGSAGGFRSQG